jgi:hypothetical protein
MREVCRLDAAAGRKFGVSTSLPAPKPTSLRPSPEQYVRSVAGVVLSKGPRQSLGCYKSNPHHFRPGQTVRAAGSPNVRSV